ncbi:hypothetical protein TKK_0013070 [Trichogramma kaykai]|uniref:Uncharacterized protein n=1 Tax=Trichogramma kaykai TaxID=54128 RepID=A0ABD2WJ86_9HYME
MANDVVCLKKLKSLREKIDWKVEEDRRKFLRQVGALITCWQGHYPNLRDIFAEYEIKNLLVETVIGAYRDQTYYHRMQIIEFIVHSNYRDKPVVDTEGKPILRRTTPIHLADKRNKPFECRLLIYKLFKIYDRFDVNYTDEYGLSHFHIACKFGLYEVVQKFLEAGQDPKCLVQITADTPLHLALTSRHKSVTELLLRSGTNSSVANAEGLTPLHIICKSYYDDKFAKILFEISDELNQLVLIQDRWGRTPLQWAVANLQPKTVDILLDHGADLKSFVFPTVSNFAERFKSRGKISLNFTLRLCVSPSVRLAETKTGALAVVERLEKRDYELERRDVITIMTFFADCGLFDKSRGVEKCWYNDEEFARKSEKLMICSDLSIHDFLRLPPKRAEKRLTYGDYFRLAGRIDFWKLPEGPREACLAHLCEMISRGFFRRWALDSLLKLTRYQLPILCCELIIEKLMNEDLCRICLAATD